MKYKNKYKFPCGCEYESNGRQLYSSEDCNIREHIYPTSLLGLAERVDRLEDIINKTIEKT